MPSLCPRNRSILEPSDMIDVYTAVQRGLRAFPAFTLIASGRARASSGARAYNSEKAGTSRVPAS
ncbi:hypothetical protein CHELA1G2_10468 [Hyphomicrobiales bacterium]|nr:hypothetical protein CHELA1G2_10468 [Hyphomicrobiales bacterium]